MNEYSDYILPIGLALLAALVVPMVIKFVGASLKAVVTALVITAILGSGAFASFKNATHERVDAEVDKRAANSDTWKKVKATKSEAASLKKKLKAGESKVYNVAGVNQKCARKLTSSATPGGKATAYLLYCEDGKTYKTPK